jgi:hypothetical protein
MAGDTRGVVQGKDAHTGGGAWHPAGRGGVGRAPQGSGRQSWNSIVSCAPAVNLGDS